MENSAHNSGNLNENWFLNRIRKYQIISFTFLFLLIYHLTTLLISYFVDKDLFIERYNLNIWFFVISLPIIYFLQWFILIWTASKLPREKVKYKFQRHPIATIIFLIIYVYDLPYRLSEYSDGSIVTIFETVLYYAFISFFWWLFFCWISSKIIKKQKWQWYWYQKVIEKFFVLVPAIYKVVLAIIVALILFFIIFILISEVFKYTGQDLKMLFY